MSSRLASFHGPSTPSSSPVAKHRTHPGSPSQSGPAESPYHRKTRTLLFEIKALTEQWDDLILLDGLRSARSLVDCRTELDNDLGRIPQGSLPRSVVVSPRLQAAEKHISDLDILLIKLSKTFRRLNTIIESLEALLNDACKTKGWTWCVEEPLWTTWPLEKFVTSLPALLPMYHRSLHAYTELVETLRSHDLGFEEAKSALNSWAAQSDLQGVSWEECWDDLCKVEVERWEKGK